MDYKDGKIFEKLILLQCIANFIGLRNKFLHLLTSLKQAEMNNK